MRVGLDTFTLRDLKLSPHATLDWLAAHRLDGALFGQLTGISPGLETAALAEFRAHADQLGLYTEVSVAGCNPHLARGDLAAHRDTVARQVAAAAAHGWHELHISLGGGDERYHHPIPWPRQLADSAAFIRALGPVLRQHGSRLNIETHGDCTTFEIVRLIEEVGPDIVGFCLDTANVLCHAEDPTEAARRAAPYTHLTHIKDAMLVFYPRGFIRQSLPPGRGQLDWERILPILAAHQPNLRLSIEDHKWLFRFQAFDPHWLRLHPDLTVPEYAAVMRLAADGTHRVAAGSLPDPHTYDRIPHVEELVDRIAAARDYLNQLVDRLDLRDRSQVPRSHPTLGMSRD